MKTLTVIILAALALTCRAQIEQFTQPTTELAYTYTATSNLVIRAYVDVFPADGSTTIQFGNATPIVDTASDNSVYGASWFLLPGGSYTVKWEGNRDAALMLNFAPGLDPVFIPEPSATALFGLGLALVLKSARKVRSSALYERSQP